MKIKGKIYFGIFILLVSFFSVGSFLKLIDFYINDKVVNNEWNISANSKFEQDYISNFSLKTEFVNLNGWINSLIGQNEMNGVVKLSNGYLMTRIGKVSSDVIRKEVEQVDKLQNYLQERDIDFMYISTPYVISKYEPEVSKGILDYGNDNIDMFKGQIEENINYVDLREEFYRLGYNQYDLFYRTDHHWTTQGGFLAYTIIIERMEELLGVEIPQKIKDISNYTIETYEQWHLGSRGQRVGRYFAGIDSFDLILPRFDTKLVKENTGEEGTFEELIIDETSLEERDYTSRYTYDSVLRGALSAYYNEMADNDKRIIIISDSMGKAVNQYFVLSFSHVYTIDAYNPSQLTEEFLEEYQPDMVIIMHYPEMLNRAENFSFSCVED